MMTEVISTFETSLTKTSPWKKSPQNPPPSRTVRLLSHIQHFDFQLTHTTLKSVGLLRHFKISKTTPTCFGLQWNHHQGATISTEPYGSSPSERTTLT